MMKFVITLEMRNRIVALDGILLMIVVYSFDGFMLRSEWRKYYLEIRVECETCMTNLLWMSVHLVVISMILELCGNFLTS